VVRPFGGVIFGISIFLVHAHGSWSCRNCFLFKADTLVGGAAAAGHIGDVYGRKRALMLSVAMMATSTFAMGSVFCARCRQSGPSLPASRPPLALRLHSAVPSCSPRITTCGPPHPSSCRLSRAVPCAQQRGSGRRRGAQRPAEAP
jgi:hypothetical protein